jgi:hypothetical protein
MSYDCGKRSCVCVTCMQWCSNTKSLHLLVSNLHDIILVHTQYVLVCTCLYHYTRYVLVRTRYVPVRTGNVPVRTKYPVLVQPVTIPEVCSRVTELCCYISKSAELVNSIRIAVTASAKWGVRTYTEYSRYRHVTILCTRNGVAYFFCVFCVLFAYFAYFCTYLQVAYFLRILPILRIDFCIFCVLAWVSFCSAAPEEFRFS